MEIISKIIPDDGKKWCIEVTVRTKVALRPGVLKRHAQKVVRLCGYDSEEEAASDEARVREKVARNKAFW